MGNGLFGNDPARFPETGRMFEQPGSLEIPRTFIGIETDTAEADLLQVNNSIRDRSE